MSTAVDYRNTRWDRHPDAEARYRALIDDLVGRSPALRDFSVALLQATGIRLPDIVDHLILSDSAAVDDLAAAGWQQQSGIWSNDAGMFPAVLAGPKTTVMIRVEAIEDFALAHGLAGAIAGQPCAPIRTAIAFDDGGVALGVIERNGGTGYTVQPDDAAEARQARLFLQAFRARRRQFDTVEAGLAAVEALVDDAVAAIGPHRACAWWLRAEREYWMLRCAAGRVQKARQDAFGIGWANIDHHTYDGSRRHFRHTIRILGKLGYERREMLYAGELAGWGSQVLEQPVIGSTIFADVDLAPEELTVDFASDILPNLPRHRRAGLISALIGESILEAGLNHVAGLYDQAALRAQLGERGIAMMTPFSAMPHLYQELTLGDWAAVDPARIDRLEAEGHIAAEEAEKLRLEGTIVTHLENIERNDGFKGFNREGIDSVLRKLDPRAYAASASG